MLKTENTLNDDYVKIALQGKTLAFCGSEGKAQSNSTHMDSWPTHDLEYAQGLPYSKD